MMTAPSCIAALTKKMFFKSSLLTRASTMVPVRAMSSSAMSRSKTMSTPVRDLDISVQASTVCAMAFSMADTCCVREKGLNERSLLEPSWSISRRISGWNSTISASAPRDNTWLRIK